MNAVTAKTCPEPEALAAFLEGSLSGAELESTAAHLRECEACRFVIGETSEFMRNERASRPVSLVRRWPVWAAAAAVAAVAILLPLRDRFRDPLDDLQPADHRLIQARLTAFDYAPFRVTRGPEEPADLRRIAAAAELQERLQEKRTPENLHRYALAELSLGRAASAKALLEEAAKREPENAQIASDLAAALYASGDYANAARHAARALERDPSLAPAAFNRALALEASGDRRAAAKAWQDYAKLDRTSDWAKEASFHLDQIRRYRE